MHIDHVGACLICDPLGFLRPIYCSEPNTVLLPLVIEDAFKVGVIRNASIIQACLKRLANQLVALPYQSWHTLPVKKHGHKSKTEPLVKLRLSKVGHI